MHHSKFAAQVERLLDGVDAVIYLLDYTKLRTKDEADLFRRLKEINPGDLWHIAFLWQLLQDSQEPTADLLRRNRHSLTALPFAWNFQTPGVVSCSRAIPCLVNLANHRGHVVEVHSR
jgi:hypothetical protein